MKENYNKIMKINKTIMKKKIETMEEITTEVFLKKKNERKEIIEHIFTENFQEKKKKRREFCPNFYQNSYAK